MDKKEIIKAWLRIRQIDNTIPDDVLNFMKESAIEALSLPIESEVEETQTKGDKYLKERIATIVGESYDELLDRANDILNRIYFLHKPTVSNDKLLNIVKDNVAKEAGFENWKAIWHAGVEDKFLDAVVFRFSQLSKEEDAVGFAEWMDRSHPDDFKDYNSIRDIYNGPYKKYKLNK